jgi:hypothetical protein
MLHVIALTIISLLQTTTPTATRIIGGPVVWSVDPSVTFAQCGTPPAGVFSHCDYGSGSAYSTGATDSHCPTSAACWVIFLPIPGSTSAVSSVNGKTGAVVLAATSTATFAPSGAATVTTVIQ